MSAPRLPARLRAVAALVPGGSGAVADVGAGHGALAAHLAGTGRRVIATEAAPGPLAELRANLDRWGASDRVETRLGSGLEPIAEGEVDGAVAAGMGARTLLSVCAAAPSHRLRWLVLQCVQDAELVMPWLESRGWHVVEHELASQGRHVYPTWLVEVAS